MPRTEPAANEVLIRLAAASLNHLDVWVRKGLPSVPKPRILGADGAGVVEALGGEVSGFEPGQRVVINPGVISNGRMHVVGEAMDGTHAESSPSLLATSTRSPTSSRSSRPRPSRSCS